MKISDSEYQLLQVVSLKLGVNPGDLYRLIDFESGWNPSAKNPYSSARGLIQFTDSTAVKLGFNSSLDLVRKNPAISDQLLIVERYLNGFAPFYNKQSLYLSVLYPAARTWLPSRLLPEAVRNVNPGINTINDYIKKIEGGDGVSTMAVFAAVLVAAGFLFLLQK